MLKSASSLITRLTFSDIASREDWIGPLPKPYHPIFIDGFAPYGPPDMSEPPLPQSYGSRYQPTPQPQPQPIHRGVSAPPPQTNSYHHQPPIRDRSVDNVGS